AHSRVVDVAYAVPEEVAARRLNEQRPLTDAEPRPRIEAPERRLALDSPHADLVSGRLHFREGRPLLPAPADVLTLVVADKASSGRRRALCVLHSAGLADVAIQRSAKCLQVICSAHRDP